MADSGVYGDFQLGFTQAKTQQHRFYVKTSKSFGRLLAIFGFRSTRHRH